MPYVYVQATPQVRGNGSAIAALVTGLVGLVLTVVTGWIPFVGFFLILLPTMLAIIFGMVGKAQARRGAPYGATATAGLTCGFIGLLLTALMQACWGLLIGGMVMSASEVDEDTAAVEEVSYETHQEIQRRLEAEWARMQAGFPELEIEIDEPDAPLDSTAPSSEITNKPAEQQGGEPNEIDAEKNTALRKQDDQISEASNDPPII
jgi:hypothetical protein